MHDHKLNARYNSLAKRDDGDIVVNSVRFADESVLTTAPRFADLPDVNVSDSELSSILVYQNGQITQGNASFSQLNGVDLSGTGNLLRVQPDGQVVRGAEAIPQYALNDLTDVTTSGAGPNEVLRYNSQTQQFETAAITTGTQGMVSMATTSLNDVSTTAATDGQVLTYDAQTSTYIPQAPSGGGLDLTNGGTISGNLTVTGSITNTTDQALLNWKNCKLDGYTSGHSKYGWQLSGTGGYTTRGLFVDTDGSMLRAKEGSYEGHVYATAVGVQIKGDTSIIAGGTGTKGGTLSVGAWLQLGVYATTAARDAAITSPAAGMVLYLTSTNKMICLIVVRLRVCLENGGVYGYRMKLLPVATQVPPVHLTSLGSCRWTSYGEYSVKSTSHTALAGARSDLTRCSTLNVN